MKTTLLASIVLLSLAAPLLSPAQRRDDPLTQPEIDQLRDTAVEPELRMKLYVQFARARLVALEQMRSDPKTKDRARQTHDMLADFAAVYNELNDNLDNFVERRDDLRRALKWVMEGDTEFQAKLHALKDDSRTTPKEADEYQFVLSDAIESVDNGAADHRKLLAEEQEAWKHKKKGKS
jgi:predicted  nucleic acid-binding Zn-ribbon protein